MTSYDDFQRALIESVRHNAPTPEAAPTRAATPLKRWRRGPLFVPSQRQWRSPLTVTAGLALAALAAAFLVAPAITPVDPVSEARAALGGPGDLLHFVVVAGNGANRGDNSACSQHRATEVWQATSGTPRWRTVEPGLPEGCGVLVNWDGTVAPGPVERARDGGTETTWYKQIKRLEVITRTTGPKRVDYPGLLFGGPRSRGGAETSGNPIGRLRALLGEGTLREGGRSRVAGREVVHLIGATEAQIEGRETRFDLAVDARTFTPVRFVTSYVDRPDLRRRGPSVADDDRSTRTTWTADFVVYEQRPMTAGAARELTIRPESKPKTQFTFTEDEFQREIDRLAKNRPRDFPPRS